METGEFEITRVAYSTYGLHSNTSSIASTPTKTHLTTSCSTNASRSKLLGKLGEVHPFVMRECCNFYPNGDIFQRVQESRDILVENFINQALVYP